jgi:hypothetical protein
MLKYLQRQFDRIKKQKDGISGNSTVWTGSVDTVLTKQADLDAITLADQEVTAAEVTLKQKQLAARNMSSAQRTKADATDKRVQGFHPENTDKWLEYGTPVPATPQDHPLPAQGVILSVEDDSDGEGFIITTKNDENGEYLEIEIGSAAANVMTLAPPFPVVKTTKKLKYTDNNVVAGTRYFYRVRWVNAKGAGAWSEVAVSGVQ